MATIERFDDIEAWQAGRKLRRAVYRLTRAKPFAADFALVDQIRRAAVSNGSNIADGFDRGGNRELYCAVDENYITDEQFHETYRLAESTARLIGGFMAYLRNSVMTGHKFDTASARANSKPKTQNPKTTFACLAAASSPASTSTPAVWSRA